MKQIDRLHKLITDTNLPFKKATIKILSPWTYKEWLDLTESGKEIILNTYK